MDLLFISKFIAVPSSFLLGSYNAVFSQNVMPHLYTAPATITAPMFSKVYYLGAKTIAPVAATAILTYGYLAYTSSSNVRRSLYISSAVLTLSTLVYTQTLMKPGITRLLQVSEDATLLSQAGIGREVTALLKNWTSQNAFRASMHVTAGVLGMYALLSEP